MKIFTLWLYIIIFSILLQSFFCTFRPTRKWWIRKLRLYKIFPSVFKNIESEEEVLALINILIIYRCSDENKIVKEIRNGYFLKYFPEGVAENKRVWDFNYIEIFDNYTDVTLRIGFDADNTPKYQIEHQQTYKSFLKMFYNQEEDLDPEECFSSANGRFKIIKNYRDYVMRDIL